MKRMLAGLVLAVIAVAPAAGDMRCGDSLVAAGDTEEQVLERCGPPASRTVRSEERVEPVQLADGEMANEAVAIPVEEWVYNLGPTRFVYTLVFRNGELAEISQSGYGE